MSMLIEYLRYLAAAARNWVNGHAINGTCPACRQPYMEYNPACDTTRHTPDGEGL